MWTMTIRQGSALKTLTYEVIENREMVTLTVKNLGGELISPGDSTATVRVSTRDDTALAGTNGDYISHHQRDPIEQSDNSQWR